MKTLLQILITCAIWLPFGHYYRELGDGFPYMLFVLGALTYFIWEHR